MIQLVQGGDHMNRKQSIYTLTISTPDGVIDVPIQHRVVNENDDNMQTTISVKIKGHEMRFVAETTNEVLIKLAKTLPSEWNIKSCLSCRYGHFCPVGNFDNELFCVTEFEPKEISDLWPVTEKEDERSKRRRNLFHLCDQYVPQSDNYFTYNDYRFSIKNL